ncbi:MAG: electron transport complex subunit RsxC [Thiobacillus sp.]|nr:electron transport complex subunit RsxC [Thiobacillus sp.]MDP2979978.1 electron transport complex subunit RsxC [Thiobacillus sp.]
MKLFKMRGGVHPEARKADSSERPIRILPLPPLLHVPLQQHIGAPAKPVVRVGEKVLAGQLLGVGQGHVTAPVHAPTSGYVVAIGDHPAPHPSGLSAATVTIAPDGEGRWFEYEVPADPFVLAPDDISARAGAAGIVGLGGAAFPSSVKLDASRQSGVDTLVINGGECEPYLTCDDRIMRERAAGIVTGIRLIQHAVGAGHAIVGIEDNKPEALAAMRAAAVATGVQIRAVPAMYPMGWEKQMIHALLGREVPAEGRSADIGVLVHNVATAWAVQQAICLARPLVSRIVTVSGGAVIAPCNLEVPIGTPVQALFDACGGFRTTPARLVLGGPMMGQQIVRTSVPVVKGTSGVLALTQAEIGRAAPAPCIRCSTCVRACPVGLLPLEIAARVRSDDLAGAVALGLKDCIGCGSCSYVCPSGIPLVHFFNYAKGDLAAQARSKAKQETTRKLAAERSARMERIVREREEAAAARKAAKAAKEAAARAAATTEAAA